MEKMAWDGPKWGQEDFVPTDPDLADILGRMDLEFEMFLCYYYYFCLFGEGLDPKFPDFQVPRSQNLWISRSPGLQIPRSPNSQISRFPDFQTPPPAPDEFSDPNLAPLPTHPGIKFVARALAAIFM